MKQWSDGDAAEDSKERHSVTLYQPCDRNSRRQGATHELCPRPCKLEIAKRPEKDKQLGSGAIDHPEVAARLSCHRRASSETAVGSETQSPPKAMGTTLPPLCNWEPLHTKHSWFGDHYHPEGAPRCPPIVPLPPLRNGSRASETTVHSNTNGQSQRTRCAHSHRIALVLPRFYPHFTPLSPCDGVKAG